MPHSFSYYITFVNPSMLSEVILKGDVSIFKNLGQSRRYLFLPIHLKTLHQTNLQLPLHLLVTKGKIEVRPILQVELQRRTYNQRSMSLLMHIMAYLLSQLTLLLLNLGIVLCHQGVKTIPVHPSNWVLFHQVDCLEDLFPNHHKWGIQNCKSKFNISPMLYHSSSSERFKTWCPYLTKA